MINLDFEFYINQYLETLIVGVRKRWVLFDQYILFICNMKHLDLNGLRNAIYGKPDPLCLVAMDCI